MNTLVNKLIVVNGLIVGETEGLGVGVNDLAKTFKVHPLQIRFHPLNTTQEQLDRAGSTFVGRVRVSRSNGMTFTANGKALVTLVAQLPPVNLNEPPEFIEIRMWGESQFTNNPERHKKTFDFLCEVQPGQFLFIAGNRKDRGNFREITNHNCEKEQVWFKRLSIQVHTAMLVDGWDHVPTKTTKRVRQAKPKTEQTAEPQPITATPKPKTSKKQVSIPA